MNTTVLAHPAVLVQIEIAYAQAVTKQALRLYADDPIKWAERFYPENRQEMERYSPQFGEGDVMQNPHLLRLLSLTSAWVRKHCGQEAATGFAHYLADLQGDPQWRQKKQTTGGRVRA